MASGPESELAESATLPPTKAPASSDDAGTLPPSGRFDPSITPRMSSEQVAPLETPGSAAGAGEERHAGSVTDAHRNC